MPISWIIPRNDPIRGRVVMSRRLVLKFCSSTLNQESMRKARRNPQLEPIVLSQLHRRP